jgi:hypothetical protein
VTPDGLVVVGSAGPFAFRWTQTHGMQDWGGVPGRDFVYFVNAVSDDGRTAAGGGRDLSTSEVAVRWTLDGGGQDLGYIANSGGVPTAEPWWGPRPMAVSSGTKRTG